MEEMRVWFSRMPKWVSEEVRREGGGDKRCWYGWEELQICSEAKVGLGTTTIEAICGLLPDLWPSAGFVAIYHLPDWCQRVLGVNISAHCQSAHLWANSDFCPPL